MNLAQRRNGPCRRFIGPRPVLIATSDQPSRGLEPTIPNNTTKLFPDPRRTTLGINDKNLFFLAFVTGFFLSVNYQFDHGLNVSFRV